MYRELLNEPFFKPALRSLPTSKEVNLLSQARKKPACRRQGKSLKIKGQSLDSFE
jgi:hypothetical protein